MPPWPPGRSRVLTAVHNGVNKKDDDHDKHKTGQYRENTVKKTTDRFTRLLAFLQADFLCLGLSLHGFIKKKKYNDVKE